MTRAWTRLSETFGFFRGNILVLTISGSLGMFSRSMVFPYVPLYILALGGSSEKVGLVYALGPLGGLLMFPIAGYLADRVNRAKLIAVAGYFSAAMLLINVVAPTWEWVAAARLLQGLAVFHFPASSAIVADSLPPQHRGRGMATMMGLSGSLALFAPYVAGTTLDAWGVESGMRILYLAMAVAYAAGATINLIFLRPVRPAPADRMRMADLAQTFRTVYGDILPTLRGFSRSLKGMAAVIILCFVCNGISGPFWVIYAKTHTGLTSSQWGLILLIEALLRNLVTIPAGFLIDRFGRRRFVVSGLLAACGFPLFLLADSFTQVLLVRGAVGVIAAFFGPALGALLADTVPSAVRGRVMAAIGRGSVMVGGAGGGIGGPSVGFLITGPLMLASLCGGKLYAWHPSIPFLFALAATAAALLIAVRFVRQPTHAEV